MKIIHLSMISLLITSLSLLPTTPSLGQKVLRVGVAESDRRLIARYKKSYRLPDSLFYNTLPELIAYTHPDAVLAYNAISEHIGVVEICAPLGISVMVEKPLATTVKDANRHYPARISQRHSHHRSILELALQY